MVKPFKLMLAFVRGISEQDLLKLKLCMSLKKHTFLAFSVVWTVNDKVTRALEGNTEHCTQVVDFVYCPS